MTDRSRPSTLLTTFAAAAMLAACSTSTAPSRYLLIAPERAEAASRTERPVRLALERVGVPGYLSDTRVATGTAPRIAYASAARWAEEPRLAITDALAAMLGQAGDLTVLTEPWPRGFEPDYRLAVDFSRFLRTEGGGASLAGEMILSSGDGDEVIAIAPFSLRAEEDGEAYDAFFASASSALEDLAARARAEIEAASSDEPAGS